MADVGRKKDRERSHQAQQVAGVSELIKAWPPAHIAEAVLDVALQGCIGPQKTAGRGKEGGQGQAHGADLGKSAQGPAHWRARELSVQPFLPAWLMRMGMSSCLSLLMEDFEAMGHRPWPSWHIHTHCPAQSGGPCAKQGTRNSCRGNACPN